MIKIIISISLCLIFLSCNNKSNIQGKWALSDLPNKYISEFKEDGLVLTECYDIKSNKKLSINPLVMKYSTYKKGAEWYIDFYDTITNKKISSPFKLLGVDTLVIFSKRTIYKNKDSIVTWDKRIHVKM